MHSTGRILRKLGKLPEDKVRKKFKSKARNSANSRVLSTTEEAKTFVGGNLAAESKTFSNKQSLLKHLERRF